MTQIIHKSIERDVAICEKSESIAGIIGAVINRKFRHKFNEVR